MVKGWVKNVPKLATTFRRDFRENEEESQNYGIWVLCKTSKSEVMMGSFLKKLNIKRYGRFSNLGFSDLLLRPIFQKPKIVMESYGFGGFGFILPH
jgi:hypothetical protein